MAKDKLSKAGLKIGDQVTLKGVVTHVRDGGKSHIVNVRVNQYDGKPFPAVAVTDPSGQELKGEDGKVMMQDARETEFAVDERACTKG